MHCRWGQIKEGEVAKGRHDGNDNDSSAQQQLSTASMLSPAQKQQQSFATTTTTISCLLLDQRRTALRGQVMDDGRVFNSWVGQALGYKMVDLPFLYREVIPHSSPPT